MGVTGASWVLVTGGGNGRNKTTLATVRSLAAAGYRPAVTVSVRHSMAASSRFCERRVRVPPATAPGYADAVGAELAARPYLETLPTSDAALVALGSPVAALLDKRRLDELARGLGLAGPPTQSFPTADAMRAKGREFTYPIVVKPAAARYQARRVDSVDALCEPLPDNGPVLVQPFLSGGLRAVGGVLWQGRLVAAVHQRYLRTWPVDCGGASAAETVAPDLALEDRLVALLQGYSGVFMAQLSGEYLLDLNPRVYGSMPLATAAGVNLAGAYCDLLGGAAPPTSPRRGRPGVFYRWLEGDVRHVATLLRRREAGPWTALRALRPRRGAAHGPESLRDPGPVLARVRYVAAKSRTRDA
jgi:predicted ATP-grasp superfamily ATP-dependent carboligase